MSDDLRDWIGRSAEAADLMDPHRCRIMQAALDLPATAAHFQKLPALWHWLFYPSETPTADLADDGHPAHDPMLPPVDLPARMWAGGRLKFHHPISLGELVWRRSEVWDIQRKVGRAGPLCFVTVRHDYTVDDDLVLSEEHDIVYRGIADPGTTPAPPPPAPDPASAEISQTITPSVPLLFRYSALTYNAHRIHYDRDFCRNDEGYPGLVVHGPLTATLLAGLAEKMAGPLASFDFRATAPLFDTAPFSIHGRRIGDNLDLWAATPEGGLAMRATARPL